jgi:NDP-sugar pyrophosphorylase family protein
MGDLGRRRQKTMLPVWGTPLLELVLTHLCPAVADPDACVVLLTGHRGHEVTDAVPDWQNRIDPRIHVITEHAPGAAGVLHLAQSLPAPILIVAGNVLLDYSNLLPRLLRQWHTDGRPVATGSTTWRTTGHHTLTAQQTTVTSWHRAPHRHTGRYEVVDTYLITPQVVDLMRTQGISHTRALAALVPDQAVAFCEVFGDWLHIEIPADLSVDPSRKDSLCLPSCPPPSSLSADPLPQARPPSPSTSPPA